MPHDPLQTELMQRMSFRAVSPGGAARVVLLNGPPRVGKDTAAAALLDRFVSAARLGFADELKVMTHRLYGHPGEFDAFEHCKDTASAAFLGATPRQAYIGVSERLMKPLHGDDVFGRLWSRRAAQLVEAGAQMIVVPDSGFHIEAMSGPIASFGADRVLLLRLHRRGHDFSNDSRGHIDLPGVRAVDVINADRASFLARVIDVVTAWLARSPA